MKLNRFLNNATIILNSNRVHRKSIKPNPSYLLSNNNDTNNVSITTNASAIRNNSPRNYKIIALPTSPKHFFHNKLSKCGSLPLLSPTSSRMKQHQFQILDKADDIIKERFKIREMKIESFNKYEKRGVLKVCKNISLKNYIINLLQDKRIEINDKERMMNNALIEFGEQFNNDYKTFMEYVEDVKKKQRIVDDLINALKEEREKKEVILNEKTFEFKRLEELMEKRLKLIYTANKYAKFVNKVFNLPFSYNNVAELNRNLHIEEIADELINIHEKKDINIPLPSILNDENILDQKYTELEDIIIYSLHNRDLIIKDIQKSIENNKNELKLLENNKKEYEKDLNYLEEEVMIVKKAMKGLKVHNQNEIDDYIDCIFELGKEITDKAAIKNIKNNNDAHLLYCKKVLSALEEKEVHINKYINEIESIINYGEKEDQNLLENCISEIKRINKKENQLKMKKRQELLEKEKNMRYMLRAQRMVVKGRNASPIFPLIKQIPKIRRIKILQKQKEQEKEMDYVYSLTDEEK
jgi:hypothetical protein